MTNENYKRQGVVLADKLIKKRSFITSSGEVIKEDEDNKGEIARYLRTRRR